VSVYLSSSEKEKIPIPERKRVKFSRVLSLPPFSPPLSSAAAKRGKDRERERLEREKMEIHSQRPIYWLSQG